MNWPTEMKLSFTSSRNLEVVKLSDIYYNGRENEDPWAHYRAPQGT
jgi:hypothetical protein